MEWIGLFFLIISVAIGGILRNRLTHYAHTPLQANLSGAEVAEKMLRTYGIEGGLERCTIKFFKLDFFATKEHERGKSLVVSTRHNWSFVSSNQHDAASTLNNFISIAFYEHNVVRQSV